MFIVVADRTDDAAERKHLASTDFEVLNLRGRAAGSLADFAGEPPPRTNFKQLCKRGARFSHARVQEIDGKHKTLSRFGYLNSIGVGEWIILRLLTKGESQQVTFGERPVSQPLQKLCNCPGCKVNRFTKQALLSSTFKSQRPLHCTSLANDLSECSHCCRT